MEASVLGGPLAFSALAVAALVSLCVWLAVRYDRQQQQRSVGVKDGVSSQYYFFKPWREKKML